MATGDAGRPTRLARRAGGGEHLPPGPRGLAGTPSVAGQTARMGFESLRQSLTRSASRDFASIEFARAELILVTSPPGLRVDSWAGGVPDSCGSARCAPRQSRMPPKRTDVAGG